MTTTNSINIPSDVEHTANHIGPNTSKDTARSSSMCSRCIGCMLGKLCLAGGLDSESLAKFELVVAHSKPLRKGKHLYWQDAPFTSVYVVHSGAVKSYRISPEGKERVLGFYMPGELIGADGLYKDRYTHSVMTLDTTTVCELPYQNLLTLFRENEKIHRRFLSLMCENILEEQQLIILAQKSTEERMAAFLLGLSRRFQSRNLSGHRFQLLMTRKDIASYLGLAVETVSRVLSRFQERGWLHIERRQVHINDIAALKAVLSDCMDELEF